MMEVTVKIIRINGTSILSKDMQIDSVFDFTRIAPIRNSIIRFLKETDNFVHDTNYTLEVKEHDNDYIITPGTIKSLKFVSADDLLHNVMYRFNTSYEYMYENRTETLRYFTEPRHVFFTLAKIFTRETLETIGRYFGKNHATVLASFRSVFKSLSVKNDQITKVVRDIGFNYNNPLLVYKILNEDYFTFQRRSIKSE